MRILLVEDERDMASWLMRALAQSGFVPDHAADARSAEAFMAGNEYDAIVMDLRLPDKHGLVVLREMRNRDDRTPVLLLTAQGALQDRVRGSNLGADDFLTKPFALEELEARLTALVRSRGRQHPRLQCGSLSYDSESRAFTLDGSLLFLTSRARRPGGVADPQRLSGGQVAAVRQGLHPRQRSEPGRHRGGAAPAAQEAGGQRRAHRHGARAGYMLLKAQRLPRVTERRGRHGPRSACRGMMPVSGA